MNWRLFNFMAQNGLHNIVSYARPNLAVFLQKPKVGFRDRKHSTKWSHRWMCLWKRRHLALPGDVGGKTSQECRVLLHLQFRDLYEFWSVKFFRPFLNLSVSGASDLCIQALSLFVHETNNGLPPRLLADSFDFLHLVVHGTQQHHNVFDVVFAKSLQRHFLQSHVAVGTLWQHSSKRGQNHVGVPLKCTNTLLLSRQDDTRNHR